MRDDSHVRRFRVSPFWLKMALYTLLLLILVSCVSIYAAYTFWHENSSLLDERKDLKTQLLESQAQLERLQNVEKILESNNPEELQSMFGLAIQSQESGVEQLAPEPPAAAAASQTPPADETPVPPETSAPAAQAPLQPQPPSVDLHELLGNIDTGLATVDSLHLEVTNREAGQLQLAFDLVNADSRQALNGRVKVFFIANDGRLLPPKIGDSDLTFQIQRFKNMSATLQLPDELKLDQVYGLKLFINTPEGDTILSRSYALNSLLT